MFTVVLPAYNESQRLLPYLICIKNYLSDSDHEVIVVDDGSTDGMIGALSDIGGRWSELRILRHEINQGKGAAVRTGIREASGEVLLVADSDGATPIEEEKELRRAIDNGADVAVGWRSTRCHMKRCKRKLSRRIVGQVYATMSRQVLPITQHDPQCGFKMFRSQVAQNIEPQLREDGYAFDIEALTVASMLGYRIAEVPINWTERDGSHISVVRDSVQMLYGTWRVHRRSVKADVVPKSVTFPTQHSLH